ncbi:MAG: endolytic transglycosylase MltG [Candidatus Pacebacteria bacterium]|nr:endolytic transglycosylase MltG [Candidatus Paceibacterota bacterium]PIR64024.1 MAG: endolytic transglycosylase MltG [Candidatus Pacebacteria bacterium CG10_big_fil_rev_8_21_14_0_10_40_26]PIZ79647.1 MAG: endolytic transglycosylase MltG [Candidatus Pacebacteria bacterium CG_4_10_14_0_2_um_filter_40_20]PJA69100.1 MAG: endolytic transglycosylase MltG [Candidatus Pacebacteria bacterium CG_4_9_14_3_um_filter_40_12]PJC41766.1 MAG: endolytic transglycosylase MltG [Candidatus Pacebacteria bacterium 
MKKMSDTRSKMLVLLFVFLFAVGCVISIVLYSLFTPVSASVETQSFVIPKGQGISTIGERLTQAGLLKHPLVFRFVVIQQQLGGKIQAGSFKLSPSMTPFEMAQTLTEGTEDVWITFLEGWRAEEMAEYLASKEELAAFDPELFLSTAKEYPGMLYPDTYLIPREMEADAIVLLLVNTFESKITAKVGTEVEKSDRDFDDVLIMASIVQREARDYEQMRHVAGILWNRIDIGMALQVDATLQFVRGTSAQWWPNPTAADKALVSPFNTYQNVGLPPQPISNPGIEAIQATLDYLDVPDLFYIHDPATGKMYFAETIDQHNANVNKYLR